jgi:hypothetical protein
MVALAVPEEERLAEPGAGGDDRDVGSAALAARDSICFGWRKRPP